jgi:tRNA dimethylallyltransferase
VALEELERPQEEMNSRNCINTDNSQSTKPLIVITGTNASGKSQLAIELAQRFGGEIVSADSRQIYKGLNLGAGKVNATQQLLVPHHLLDIAHIRDNFTLGEFLPLAYRAIAQIHDRAKLPFVVGGTGLYVTAIVENYSIPKVPPNVALRDQLEAMDTAALMELLQQKDPSAAERIDINNRRRIIRALEVCIQTGKPFSDQIMRGICKYRTMVLGLTWPRRDLYRMIDDRVDRRIGEGMIEEVRDLLDSGVPPERLWELGLEYRIISKFLLGHVPSQEQMTLELKFAIHRFARRQLSWFRRKSYVRWLDCTDDYKREAEQLIQEFLSTQDASQTGVLNALKELP